MALSRAACVWRACSGLVTGHRLLLPAAVRTQSSGHRLLLPAAVRTQSSGHRLLLPAAVRTQSSGHRLLLPAAVRTQSSGSGLLLPAAVRTQSSGSGLLLPRTSLSSPPWPELLVPLEEEESRLEEQHAAVVSTVNRRILQRDFGRLFAVVHFSGRQWKVTAEDLVLLENRLEAQCGERIRMEKVLLVGAEDFTLLGRPLLDRDLVRVEATVIERTESWPKVHMRFWKRHRFQRKRIIIQPQTVLRINSIQLNPALS